jgi:hypothetical protein
MDKTSSICVKFPNDHTEFKVQLYTLHNKKKLIGLGNKLQELILIPIQLFDPLFPIFIVTMHEYKKIGQRKCYHSDMYWI